MVTRKKACDISKVLECCRQRGPNLHIRSFKYFLPNLHKFLLPLKLGIFPALPCARVHWIQKLTAKKSRFKFCELFSVWALQQMAWPQNFSNWPAKTCALIECWAQLILNTLTSAIDQLPKRTDDGYECKIWVTAYVIFYLNLTYVLLIVDISLYAEWKLT